jgi:hypothetical protein
VFYKQACDGRNSDGCYALALLYIHGIGVPKDPTRAAALFKQACQAGVAAACSSLGFLYDKGTGVPKDPTRAMDLWEHGCHQGDPLGCHNAAIAFGDENDLPRAEEFFRKACDGGLKASCQALGETVLERARRTHAAMRDGPERRQPSEPQEVCARHILVRVESPTQAGHPEAEAKSLAQGILNSLTLLAKANDFAELARKFSEDAGSASSGGDLGCFLRGVLVPKFEDVAFALEVGETSDLVRTEFGFHVIQRMTKNE